MVLLIVSGCATGPRISSREIDDARQTLDLKAFEFQCRQTVRVSDVGHRLVQHLPPDEAHEQAPYIGLLLAPLDQRVKRLYEIPETVKGAVIVGAVPDSPAARAGLQVGDVVLAIGAQTTARPKAVSQALAKAAANHDIALTRWRAGREQVVTLRPERVPFHVAFLMTDDQEINASATTGRRIFVTYGLLRFVNSDDELAVVLGHELAHHTHHHIRKEVGTSIVTSIVGMTAAVGAEIFVPGTGGIVMRGVKGAFDSSFSQDFEREADEIGLRYAYRAGYDAQAGARVWERFAVEIPRSMTKHFFNTHPTSPERLLHMEKTAVLLQAEHAAAATPSPAPATP